jgi:putative effector of murein hydrolase LrgA (UPF0299 family)
MSESPPPERQHRVRVAVELVALTIAGSLIVGLFGLPGAVVGAVAMSLALVIWAVAHRWPRRSKRVVRRNPEDAA